MRRSRALATVQAVSALLLLAGGCSIDHRRLHLGAVTGGTPSTGANGGADGGAADLPGGSGAGGSSAAPTGLVDGCADLDTDGVADCKTTLVKNASFKSDVSAWTAPTDVELAWDAKNALEDLPSGSARLKGTGARANAAQCVPVDGKRLVIAYADAFVTATADDVEFGQAELEVSFFETTDCSGDRAGFFETPASTVINSWTVVQAGAPSLDGTRSVSLALVGLKPATNPSIQVYFDNVMLQAKAL
jgi:hypothetical protein